MKPLPSSIESEQALLCACFLRPEIIPQVKAQVRTGDFYREAHALIFEALCTLMERAEPASVAEWLSSKGVLEKVGGQPYLMDLWDFASTSAGWTYHAQIIREKATRRSIIQTCARAAESAYGVDEPGDILSDLKERVRGINAQDGKPYQSNTEIVQAVWRDIERRAGSGERFVGVKTGFRVIDDRAFGLEPKTTIYLIARPSIGKTALSLNIAENIPGRVAFFSLESNVEAITRRRLASKSGVPLWQIRTANLHDEQYQEILSASSALCETSLILLDHPRYKIIENLTAQCESMAMDGPLSLIVVDHIQRMRSTKRLQNRHLELSWISEELSSLAKNLNVAILILCQLNREIEKRIAKSKYPQLYDMRECITGGTEIYTDKGPRSIRVLYQKHNHCNFYIRSYGEETGQVQYVKPAQIIHTGIKKCFRIRTKSGKMITATEDTPFFTKTGWKKLSELQCGDSILVDMSIKKTRKGITYNHGKTHFKKGISTWNKNLTAKTDVRVAANSKECMGKRVGLITPPDFSEKMKLINPPIGRKRNNRGYVLIYMPNWNQNDNGLNGYVFEHRYLVERALGRKLTKNEIIHHLDGNKQNNEISNLFLCADAKEHEEIHQLEQRFVENLIKEGKVIFDVKTRQFRLR
jgi:replicative DNA helicase